MIVFVADKRPKSILARKSFQPFRSDISTVLQMLASSYEKNLFILVSKRLKDIFVVSPSLHSKWEKTIIHSMPKATATSIS